MFVEVLSASLLAFVLVQPPPQDAIEMLYEFEKYERGSVGLRVLQATDF